MNQQNSLAQLLHAMRSGQHKARDLLGNCFERIDANDQAHAQVYT